MCRRRRGSKMFFRTFTQPYAKLVSLPPSSDFVETGGLGYNISGLRPFGSALARFAVSGEAGKWIIGFVDCWMIEMAKGARRESDGWESGGGPRVRRRQGYGGTGTLPPARDWRAGDTLNHQHPLQHHLGFTRYSLSARATRLEDFDIPFGSRTFHRLSLSSTLIRMDASQGG